MEIDRSFAAPWLAGERFAPDAVLECVPNFSEGRDRSIIRALVASLHVPGVLLLDYSSDPDHNRTVATVAGAPAAIAEAAVRAAGVAAQTIDLRTQRGVHPRMGVADVVPFVPIRGISLERTADVARLVAKELWNRHHVPAFFYEAAALDVARRRLEQVRRGQFEGAHRERRSPDIGGPGLHPSAGASIVGARDFLIAFNLLLETKDVAVAKRIGAKIRASAGGMASVKALGVPVAGHAQVTMNITNFRQTPIENVYQAVKQLALTEGTRILRGELIGLVPEAAFDPGAEWFTAIPGFIPEERILERRLLCPLPWPNDTGATAENVH